MRHTEGGMPYAVSASCHAGMRGASRRDANRPPVIRALVSVGTNSTRLLVLDGEQRVAAESRGTRLGAGIGETGTIDPAARARTLAVIDDYIAQARDAVRRRSTRSRRARCAAQARRSVRRRRRRTRRRRAARAERLEEATYSFLGATHRATATARSRCSTSAAAAPSSRSTRRSTRARPARPVDACRSRSARCGCRNGTRAARRARAGR